MKEALWYLPAITAAELITVLPIFNPLWGIVCHIVLLVVFIVRSALARQPAQQALILSLTLVPLTRIISLSMPLVNIPQMAWYPIVYAPLLIAAITVARMSGITAKDIGIKFGFVPLQLGVALVGFLLGFMEYSILRPKPFIDELTWATFWLPALIFVTSTGFVEEFIFRGVMQVTALRVFSTWWGIFYVSYIFAILHTAFLSWVDVVFVFAVGVLFAWIVKRTGSLFGVTLAHGITNILLYLVMAHVF